MDCTDPSATRLATGQQPLDKPTLVKVMRPKAPRPLFEEGDFVVYPAHGVGRVVGLEKREIAGFALDLVVIAFDQNRLTLRVPVAKAEASGLRKLSSRKIMDSAIATLRGRPRTSRGLWNRRAQEYNAKINSGDPVSIAEVVRDLHKNVDFPDRSYSERQVYESALERLVREVAAVDGIDMEAAAKKITLILNGKRKSVG
jgi:CarD family transcriptional regulator